MGDWLLIIFFLFVSGFGFLLLLRRNNNVQECVIQWQEGKAIIRLPRDTVLVLSGPVGKTTVVINGKGARITDSDCPRKLCVRMGRAERTGQVLVCVPNRVMVMLKGRGEIDAITR